MIFSDFQRLVDSCLSHDFFLEFLFFFEAIAFAQSSYATYGAGKRSRRDQKISVGEGTRSEKWKENLGRIRVEQLKRNELLPCRRRSVTDSSVFISFWHDSLVSSSLILSPLIFTSSLCLLLAFRILEAVESKKRKENEKETAKNRAR